MAAVSAFLRVAVLVVVVAPSPAPPSAEEARPSAEPPAPGASQPRGGDAARRAAGDPAGAGVAPPNTAGDGADGSRRWTEPPPGSAEDQALWRAGAKVSDQVTLSRLEANKLQWRARQGRYETRLQDLQRKADDPKAQRAGELLARYREVVVDSYVLLTRQWPVDPTRGCRYQVMHLEGVMGAEDHRRKKSQLGIVREELEDCVERGRPAVEAMAAANGQLQRLLAEADGLLPPLAP